MKCGCNWIFGSKTRVLPFDCFNSKLWKHFWSEPPTRWIINETWAQSAMTTTGSFQSDVYYWLIAADIIKMCNFPISSGKHNFLVNTQSTPFSIWLESISKRKDYNLGNESIPWYWSRPANCGIYATEMRRLLFSNLIKIPNEQLNLFAARLIGR